METLKEWVGKNPIVFGGIVALLLAAFGVCLIIGALKDWNWLYEPDGHYQNNWTMGHIKLFEQQFEECSIGFKEKEQQLAQKKNAIIARK